MGWMWGKREGIVGDGSKFWSYGKGRMRYGNLGGGRLGEKRKPEARFWTH